MATPRPYDQRRMIRHVLLTVVRGWWILAVALAVTLGAGIAYLAWADEVYRAEATVIVDTDRRASGTLDLVGIGAYRDVLVEVEVLRSLDMARRVADRLREERDRSGADMASWPIFREPEVLLNESRGLPRAVRDRMEVDQVRREVGVIRLGARSGLPEEAQRLADLYAEEYARRNLETSRSDAALLKSFLEQQMVSRSTELESTEAAIQVFQESESAVPLDREADQLASRLAELQSLEDQAMVELDMVNAQLESLREEADRIEPNLSDRVASGLESGIDALQRDIAAREVRVETKYARNPELRGNESSDPELQRDLEVLAGLRSQVTERAGRYVDEVLSTGGIDAVVVGRLGQGASIPGALANISRLRNAITEKSIEASGLEARLSVLRSRIARYESDFERIPRQSRELAGLERVRRSGESTYEWLQERYEEARVAEQSEFGNVRVLDTADLPVEPVAPRKAYTLALALMLGTIVGLLTIFLRDAMDDRPRTTDDLVRLGHDVAGFVPAGETRSRARRPARAEGAVRDTAAAYLRIAAVVDAGTSGATHPGVILVTAAAPGPDHGAVAANLAMAYASSGQPTLLVDADLDSGVLHERLGRPQAPGMANILLEGAQLHDSIFPTSGPGLYLMPFGDLDAGRSSHAVVQSLGRLLSHLRPMYPRIVVDAGSLLPSARAVSWASSADAIVLVAQAGRTDAADLDDARLLLRRAGPAPVHTVLSEAGAGSRPMAVRRTPVPGRWSTSSARNVLGQPGESPALPLPSSLAPTGSQPSGTGPGRG